MNSFIEFKNKIVSQPLNGLSIFLNPYSYLMLRKSDVIDKVDWIMIDGGLLLIILRIFGVKAKRASFDMTSMAPMVFNDSIQQEKEIYFIGSSEQNIVKFIKIIQANFPMLKIKGYRNGYFSSENEKKHAVKEIADKKPDVVIIGMGTPLQEQFLLTLKKKGWKGDGYTCGGFIHQTTTKLNYYPHFFNKYNLRWLYRMYDEPKLIKRYIINYPKSICLLIFDFVKASFEKKSQRH